MTLTASRWVQVAREREPYLIRRMPPDILSWPDRYILRGLGDSRTVSDHGVRSSVAMAKEDVGVAQAGCPIFWSSVAALRFLAAFVFTTKGLASTAGFFRFCACSRK